MLIGNVGQEPEVRYIDKDVAVARFTLATTERGYKTADGTQIPSRTEWHTIIAWRGLAKIAENYIHKGSSLFVEGKIRTRNWADKQGTKRTTTEIYAETIELLGKKSDSLQSKSPLVVEKPEKSTKVDSVSKDNNLDELPF